jgi:hypothetical protein
LLEPTTPVRFQNFWRCRLLYQLARQNLSIRRCLRGLRPGNAPPQNDSNPATHREMPEGAGRWDLMHKHYWTNTIAISRRPVTGRISLVGSHSYHSRFAGAWRRVAGGDFNACLFTGTTDHFACFRDPYAGQWIELTSRLLCTPRRLD